MNPLIQLKTTSLPLLTALTLTFFVFAPQARATCQDDCLPSANTVLGYDVLISNTVSSENTAIGTGALENNTTGGANTASNDNLFVQWSTSDPEQIDIIKWNPTGLTGSEPNLTNTFVTGGCNNGDVEYFGNSWAPPDPQVGGKVLVGAGTAGTRVPGPDDKVNIDSTSTGCPPSSAGVPVKTTYKFWQAGSPINRIKVTRIFTFTTPFSKHFRPYIPRLFPVSTFSQVLHPDASGTNLV